MNTFLKWLGIAACGIGVLAVIDHVNTVTASEDKPSYERAGDGGDRLDRIAEKLDRLLDRVESRRGPGGPPPHGDHAGPPQGRPHAGPHGGPGPDGGRPEWGPPSRGPRGPMHGQLPPEVRERMQEARKQMQDRMEKAREKFKELEERVKSLEAEVERLKASRPG
jgi:hypothetical protein